MTRPAIPVDDGPRLTVTVDGTDVTDRFGVGGQQAHNQRSSGSFTLALNDPRNDTIATGSVVVETLDGTATINEWVVRSIEPVRAGPDDDESALVVAYSGDGYSAEDAIVFPSQGVYTVPEDNPYVPGLTIATKPFSDDRYLGWMERYYDDTDWGTAVEVLAPHGTFRPDGFPDYAAMWIWDAAMVDNAHPVGTKLFRRSFTPVSPVVFAVKIVVAGLQSLEVYLDGTLIARTDPAIDTNAGQKARAVVVEINGDQPHVLAAKVEHNGSGPGGFLCSVYEHNTANVIARSSSDWKVVDAGDEPGMTPGSVWGQLAGEAADRGALNGHTATFTDSLDTRGDAWPTIVGDFAVRVLDGLDTVADQLAEGWWDWWYEPGAGPALSAVTADGIAIPGGGTATGRGQTTTVEFAEGVNCTELSYVETDDIKTAALARWADGFIYGQIDDAVTAHGRREAGLALSNVTSGPSTLWTMYATLKPISTPEVSIVVRIEPVDDTDTPFKAFGIGDRVTAPDRFGAPTEYRVMAISWDEDDAGNLEWTVELATARDVQEAVWQRWLRRTGNGTLDGRSRSATVTSPSVLSAGEVNPVEITWSTGGANEMLIGDRGTPYRPREYLIPYRLNIEADVPGATGASECQLYRNATALDTVSVAVGAADGYTDIPTPSLTSPLDTLNVEATAEGGHMGVSVTALCFPTQ